MMAVPVYTQRLKTGVLRVVRHRKGSLYFLPQEFTQADEDILVTLAGQMAVAIDRTRLTERLLGAERMAAWGEMSARAAHMIGNTVFGVKGHLNELNYVLKEHQNDDVEWAEVKELTGNVTQAVSIGWKVSWASSATLFWRRSFIPCKATSTVSCIM